MRFATIRAGESTRVGVIDGDEVTVLPSTYGDLYDIVCSGPDLLDDIKRKQPDWERVDMAAAHLQAPIARQPRDVLCAGWNYWDHFEEGIGHRDGQEVDRPEHPTFFTKGPDTIIGPTDDIAFDDSLSTKWDFEAELALVFGQGGRSIPEEDAMGHVWGYMLANDISQRDLQRAHGGQWLKGKSIDATMPTGPWVVTADELDPGDVRLECIVNGQTLQDGLTSQMAFTIPQLIAELTRGMTIRPGQIFLTGTPAGVGNARDPQVFLQAGDEVLTRGSGLGEMTNRLVKVSLTTSGPGATG